MVEDRFDDKRRAKVSRMLLRDMHDITYDDWKQAALDTTLYWPLVNLPRLANELKALNGSDSALAAKAKPYLDHLLDWDCRSSIDSTQTTLCALWYEELYGRGYPVETLKAEFVDNPAARFQALVTAAGKLQAFYGDWKVKWGDISRMQRHANYADPAQIPFSDSLPSLPCAGAPGPLGVVFNTYYAPPTAKHKKQYRRRGRIVHRRVRIRRQGAGLDDLAVRPKLGSQVAALHGPGRAVLEATVQAGLVRMDRRAGPRQEQLSSGLRGAVRPPSTSSNHREG